MSAVIPEWLLTAPTIRAAVLAYIAYSLPIILSDLAWQRVHARRAPTG